MNPLVPVDLVSTTACRSVRSAALRRREERRHRARAQRRAVPLPALGRAFRHFRAVPRRRDRAPGQPRVPGVGGGDSEDADGTSSRCPASSSVPTATVINGLGVSVGASAAGGRAAVMLGQADLHATPGGRARLVGGRRKVTATDVVLTVRRRSGRASSNSWVLRAGLEADAGPRPRDGREHGARVRGDDGVLPRGRKALNLWLTGRSAAHVDLVERYERGASARPPARPCSPTSSRSTSAVEIARPGLPPQDRAAPDVKKNFRALWTAPRGRGSRPRPRASGARATMPASARPRGRTAPAKGGVATAEGVVGHGRRDRGDHVVHDTKRRRGSWRGAVEKGLEAAPGQTSLAPSRAW